MSGLTKGDLETLLNAVQQKQPQEDKKNVAIDYIFRGLVSLCVLALAFFANYAMESSSKQAVTDAKIESISALLHRDQEEMKDFRNEMRSFMKEPRFTDSQDTQKLLPLIQNYESLKIELINRKKWMNTIDSEVNSNKRAISILEDNLGDIKSMLSEIRKAQD